MALVGQQSVGVSVADVPDGSVTLIWNDEASPASTCTNAFTSMLWIPSGAPAVSGAGLPSSPVTDADTFACAATGVSSAQASVAAATARPFFLDFIPVR